MYILKKNNTGSVASDIKKKKDEILCTSLLLDPTELFQLLCGGSEESVVSPSLLGGRQVMLL